MEVHVDLRVELISVLWHLAGSKEYQSFDTPYRRAVDAHFGPFGEHAAVAATRELRTTKGISYNAPIGLAVFLDDHLIPQVLPLEHDEDLDPRWHDVPISGYIRLVRQFAADTRFEEFFASQRSYMQAVEQRLARALADEGIETWYQQVLATPAEGASFVVVPGLLTGPWNYEAMTHDVCGRRWVYQIVELEAVDGFGLPAPTRTTTELVAHEMAHSYVNPVVDAHAADLVAAAQPLYDRVRTAMQQQSYPSPKIMVEESLVRALTVLFVRDRLGADAASQLARDDLAHGFAWNVELAKWFDGLLHAHRPLDLAALAPDLVRWFAERAATPAT